MLSPKIDHINVGKSSEAGEEEEVTDELKTRDRQLLVGYPLRISSPVRKPLSTGVRWKW